jgi:hypothetical protein
MQHLTPPTTSRIKPDSIDQAGADPARLRLRRSSRQSQAAFIFSLWGER